MTARWGAPWFALLSLWLLVELLQFSSKDFLQSSLSLLRQMVLRHIFRNGTNPNCGTQSRWISPDLFPFQRFKCLLLWRVCPDWFHWWGKTCTHWKKGEFYWLSVPSQAINIVLCFLSPGFFLYLLTKLCFACGAFWTSEPIHGLLANSIFCTVADHAYTNDALKMANDWNVCISTVNVLHAIYK